MYALILKAIGLYHEAFVSRAGNTRLTRMIMDLRDSMRLYGIDSATGEERQRASVDEHCQLINLAAKGEAKAIAVLISRHILDWQPIFGRALLSQASRAPF
jgi:DNA-binding GntR family transcriptional regulator